MGLQNLLMEFYQVYEKLYHQYGTQFFLLYEKAKYFCGKKVSTEEFWQDFKCCYLGSLLL